MLIVLAHSFYEKQAHRVWVSEGASVMFKCNIKIGKHLAS